MEETLQEGVQVEKPRPPLPTGRQAWWKKIFRLFFWLGGIVTLLFALLIVLTFVFEDDIKKYVTEELNTHLNTKIIVAPEDINLTFIKDFPQASIEFQNVTALDATNDSVGRDTLFSAREVSFSFSIMDIFRENYTIRNISLEDGMVDVRVDKHGNDNYHFLKSDTTATSTDSSEVAFALEEITFTNVDLGYSDAPSESNYKLHVNDLVFAGDFASGEFDLSTEADFLIQELKQKDVSLFKGNNGHLNLGMSINTHSGSYTITTGELQIAEFMLDLSGSVVDKQNNYLVDLLIKGKDVDIASAISLLPDSARSEIADFESTGEFYFETTIKGLSGDTLTPVVEASFGIRNGATLKKKNSGIALSNISLVGIYSNSNGGLLEISDFNASTPKSKLKGSYSMKGKNPEYTASLSGNIDLAELQEIFEFDTIDAMSGKMDIHLDASGMQVNPSSITAADLRKFKTSGDIKLSDADIKVKNSSLDGDSLSGQLTFDGNNVSIKQFSGNYSGSDFVINGAIRNLLGFIFTDDEMLGVDGEVVSRNLDLNSLLSSDESTASDTNYQLVLPERIKVHLDATVRHLTFRRFEAQGLTGSIDIRNKALYANNISFRAMDGTITGNGTIDATSSDSLLISCNSKISDVNITKLFYQFENFGQTEGTETIGDKNVSGILNSDVTFASMWDKKLNVNEKQIYTLADVSIEKGELKDFEPIMALSRFISVEELKDIKFNSLSNQIEIRNRVVSLPKMEIKSNAVDLAMSGTHDFDNMIDYHFVVSLDEFRAKKAKASKKENNEFGEEIEEGGSRRYKLYVAMKGYVDDPKISYLDRKGFIEQKKEEIKAEKQNLKEILNKEFGWFKKDTTINQRKNPDDSSDKKKPDDKGTINFKKGKDEEDAPEGDDF
jgi:hypothetical protein